MKCPKCNYEMRCPCPACIDKVPLGFKPWIWTPDGNCVKCANCGYTEHVDTWSELEIIEINKVNEQC